MTKINTTTKKDDSARFYKERNAATAMRDELSYLVGWVKSESPEIAEQLEKVLKKHKQDREQFWL